MYRDLDENNKSQLRERVDMSMRSPTNNWIDESIQKITTQKKSLSTERKVAGPSSVSHSNNTSIGDLSKIFKPQMKNGPAKGTRHSKQSISSVASGLQPAGNITGLNGIHILNSQHSISNSVNNLSSVSNAAMTDQTQYYKEMAQNHQEYSQSQVKGIGKMQPFMSEFKLNEQVIRGKLQAGNQRNTQIKNQVMQDSQSSQSK
jgi:hypothetical protein